MTVVKRPLVVVDLIEQADYLEQNAGMETAERFLAVAEQAFDQLARWPRYVKRGGHTGPPVH